MQAPCSGGTWGVLAPCVCSAPPAVHVRCHLPCTARPPSAHAPRVYLTGRISQVSAVRVCGRAPAAARARSVRAACRGRAARAAARSCRRSRPSRSSSRPPGCWQTSSRASTRETTCTQRPAPTRLEELDCRGSRSGVLGGGSQGPPGGTARAERGAALLWGPEGLRAAVPARGAVCKPKRCKPKGCKPSSRRVARLCRHVLNVLSAQQVEGDGDAGVRRERDQLGGEEREAVDLERRGQRRRPQEAHRLDRVLAQLAKQVVVPVVVECAETQALACAQAGAAGPHGDPATQCAGARPGWGAAKVRSAGIADHDPHRPEHERRAKLPSCGLLAITTLLCSAPPPPLSARYRAMKGRSRRRPRSSAPRLPTVFPAADIAQQGAVGRSRRQRAPLVLLAGTVASTCRVHTRN